jgi:prophage DNA circulation protein
VADGTIADGFEKASFEGVPIYYSSRSVKGGIRHAIHEFPHSPGGEVEKMGRKLYTITFTCMMHDIPGSDLEREYPDNYAQLAVLRQLFEEEKTGALVVPGIGKIRAVATTWTQDFNAQQRSGETLTLEFVEDQDSALLTDRLVELGGATRLEELNDNLVAQMAIADFKKAETFSVFQQINDAVTAVQGVFGQADAYSRLVEGKIRGLENLCLYADSELEEMQDPSNHLVLDALKDLWFAARQLADNVVETRQTIRVYTVKRRTTVGQLATIIYGSADRASDLLQLNGFEDAFDIPAGTKVNYVGEGLFVFSEAV